MKKLILLFGICLLMLSSVTALNDSLVYYSFDEGTYNATQVYDISGNLLNGDITGTPINSSEAVINTSFAFDGATEFITLPITFLNNITGDFHIGGWVKTNSFNSWFIGDNDRNYLRIGTGSIAVQVRGSTLQSSSEIFTDDKYHYLFFGQNGSNAYFGYNDTILNTFPIGANPASNEITIASRPEGSQYFGGRLDEIGIYQRPLSLSEISTLYNNGEGFNPYQQNITPPAPINNTYLSFIEFENNDSNTYFSSYDTNHLEILSGNVDQVNCGYRGLCHRIASDSMVIDGLNSIVGKNHTISYNLRFYGTSPTPFTNVRLFNNNFDSDRECGFWQNGTYYCSYEGEREDILSFDDNANIMFTHVYDSDSEREYVYTTKFGQTPVLRKTFTNVNGSRVLLDIGRISIQNNIATLNVLSIDEILVYNNTLDNNSINSLNDNGANNELFINHPAFIPAQPPSSVSYNTPFLNITVNSTGVNYNVNHTIATGDTPINYISSLEKGFINVSLTNSLNNDIVVSLNNSMFIANGYYDVVILSNNSEGNNRSVFSNRLFICESNYEAVYTSCVNDTQIKTYNDLASCNPSYDVPSDNGSVVVCDDGILSSSEITQAELDIKQENSYLLMIAILLILLIGVKYLVNVGGLFGAVFSLFIAMIGVYTFTLFSSPLVPIVIIIVGVIMLLIDVTKINT